MQLFFIKNIIQKLIKFTAAKRTASQLPSLSPIHHLPHNNLLRTSNDIIHLPHPKHLILHFKLLCHTLFFLHIFVFKSLVSMFGLLCHTLFFLHLLNKLLQHLIAFFVNLMQIFIQSSVEQQLHKIPMFELFQILTYYSYMLNNLSYLRYYTHWCYR